MKLIILFLLGSIVIFPNNLNTLQQKKKAYKQHYALTKQTKKHRSIFERICIVFSEKAEVEKRYIRQTGILKLEQCLTETLCIYKNIRKRSVEEISRKMREDAIDIESLKGVKREHFQRY